MAERVSWRRATINETELFQAAYSAFAVGVWRNLSARPPQDAGTVDFMCRLEEGKCKVFSWREAYAPSVHLPDGPPSQPVPDPDNLLTGRTARRRLETVVRRQNEQRLDHGGRRSGVAFRLESRLGRYRHRAQAKAFGDSRA